MLGCLNRSDNCGSFIMRRNSDLQLSRPHPGHLSLSIMVNGNFHGRLMPFGLGLTEGIDYGLIEACTLANILAQTSTDCGNFLTHDIAPSKSAVIWRTFSHSRRRKSTRDI